MNLRLTIKKVLRESLDLDPSIRRRLTISQEEIIDSYKKEVLSNFKYDKDKETIVKKSANDAAFEILDSVDEWRSMGQKRAVEELKKFSTYIFENYKDMMIKFIGRIFEETNKGDDGFLYIFIKHSNRDRTGNGYTDSHQTWYGLLQDKASYFPDLDWNEIKSQLDKSSGRTSVLIKSPGDYRNPYNYYFSIGKKPKV